ncbi:VOC family protein [Paraburkholderia oxyphila]|uniref:VOC family protein n=1 Tax=Paraburkholderia oxyphila TaxID=614212 RepID=UPI001428BB11|nr:VOC family protein [Paraburkholderia oxyphila]
MSALISGLHHITYLTSGAQDDYDFYTRVLGQTLIKKTVFYEGDFPRYHLYFSSDAIGAPGGVTTTISMPGVPEETSGRTPSMIIAYAVPGNALEAWQRHLQGHGIEHGPIETRFGERRLRVRRGLIELDLVEAPSDIRKPNPSPHIDQSIAILGFHGITIPAGDPNAMGAFLTAAWDCETGDVDGSFTRYQQNGGGPAAVIDVWHVADMIAGGWECPPGNMHHAAFAVADDAAQLRTLERLDSRGYADTRPPVHRGYFRSIYVRTPAGAIVEAATSDIGFLRDESRSELGLKLKLPPFFEERRDEFVETLRKIDPLVI